MKGAFRVEECPFLHVHCSLMGKKNERIAELERRVAELEASNHQYYWPYGISNWPYGTCLGCGGPLSNGHVCITSGTSTSVDVPVDWYYSEDLMSYG